jgi:hypothetical protein
MIGAPAWVQRISQRALFLPGALLVTIQAQLLAPFVFIDFSLAAFLK